MGVDVYVFEYALSGDAQQCFEALLPLSVCLELEEEKEMTVRVSREGKGHGLQFSADDEWHSVDEITGADSIVEKCLWVFEAKVCVQCQDEMEFTLLVYKATT